MSKCKGTLQMGHKPLRVLHSSPLDTQIWSRSGRELWSQNNIDWALKQHWQPGYCPKQEKQRFWKNGALVVKGKHVSTGEQPLTQRQLSPSSEFPSFHSCFTSISINLHLPPPWMELFFLSTQLFCTRFVWHFALGFSWRNAALWQAGQCIESEVYREPVYTWMVSFSYSHYTVQSVLTSVWWVKVKRPSIASWKWWFDYMSPVPL